MSMATGSFCMQPPEKVTEQQTAFEKQVAKALSAKSKKPKKRVEIVNVRLPLPYKVEAFSQLSVEDKKIWLDLFAPEDTVRALDYPRARL